MEVDKYLEAFPYSMYTFTKDERIIFLKEEGPSRFLHMCHIEGSLDRAQKICSIDFAKQTYWSIRFNEKDNKLYFMSDTDNKEDFNIFSLQTDSGEVTQITFNRYTQTKGFVGDFKYLVHSNQREHNISGYDGDLYLLNLETLENKFIFSTTPEDQHKFTWADAHLSKDEEYLYLRTDKNSKREKANIARINIEEKSMKILLPEEHEDEQLWMILDDQIEDSLTYNSSRDGFNNLYRLDLETNEINQLTHFTENTDGMMCFHNFDSKREVIFLFKKRESNQTLLQMYQLGKNESVLVNERILAGNYYLYETVRDNIILGNDEINKPSNFIEFSHDLKETGRVVNTFKGSLDDLSQCTYEFLNYKSFDGKDVNAYLSLPKGEIKGVMITAFYGGGNYYNINSDLLAENGIAHLSPAVRGSNLFGKSWRAEIFGDLGGNEILDVIWGARFIAKKLNLSEEKIGVWGGSHGGYATLRTLTIPNPFNGFNTKFNFGAAICAAGFADLVDFYKTSNIPDWLVQMLGEFNEEKYLERSPITHFDNLKTPLLVVHGENDSRVNKSSMDGFIQRLENSDKTHKIHILKGQGHGTTDKEMRAKEFKTKLDFLNEHLFK